MLGSGDDFLLQRLAEVAEIIAVPGNADNQIAVFFRMLLGRAKGGRIRHVELNVMPVQFKICAHQLNQPVQICIGLQKLGREFLVKQRSTGSDMIHLGRGFQNRRRPFAIRPLNRRNPFGKRLAGASAIRCCTGHGTEIDMTGRWQKIDVIGAVFGVFSTVNRLEICLENGFHDVVGVIVIIACKSTGRNFIGMEKDEKYFEIAKKRIEDF